MKALLASGFFFTLVASLTCWGLSIYFRLTKNNPKANACLLAFFGLAVILTVFGLLVQ